MEAINNIEADKSIHNKGKKLHVRWDIQTEKSLKTKKYLDASSALGESKREKALKEYTLTEAEVVSIRRGEAQIKAGRAKPWATVKENLRR